MSLYLELLGWNPRIKYKGPAPSKEPFIACLSHTAGGHEFLLYWLYCQTNSLLKRSCLIMAGKDNPLFDRQPHKWFLSKVNTILLGDKRWSEAQGYVDTIVTQAQKGKYTMVIIAPSGKDKKSLPWKTGYYHIGKKLGWGFRVVGFDFETKRLKIGPLVTAGQTLSETQLQLQRHMSDIVPYREKNSFITIREHNSRKVSLTTKDALIPLLLIIIVAVTVFCLRKDAGRSVWDSMFHVIVSLYGLYLQSNKDITIRCIGLSIIYQHILVIYLGCPRLPENIVTAGALLGVIIGLDKNERSVYIPMLYSLLSKIPNYAKDKLDQGRAIVVTVALAILLHKIHT